MSVSAGGRQSQIVVQVQAKVQPLPPAAPIEGELVAIDPSTYQSTTAEESFAADQASAGDVPFVIRPPNTGSAGLR